ncbi:hypothetical protein EDC30_101252 [Paucimonas lemoignei]|uniref:Lipoprotein n=1 Tax=Paucimonas lemoignei TaxID=29443 RepID=A0A4R3I0R7_PAULE|nr:hypothetical protein [Paucimonas lemoignei]TCS39297.1 hypothetical protein EDC30_101252 [Paucimonas lemoignei]
MQKILNTKSLATFAFALIAAGCGGGGGGDETVASSQGPSTGSGDTQTPPAGNTQTPPTGGNETPADNNQPRLAAATTVSDGAALGTSQWPDGSTATGGLGQDVNGLTCSTDPATYTYTQLIVLQNGQQVAVPANIGVGTPTLASPATCVYPVHTKDQTGKIRVNGTTGATYTLGQFFEVWGQPLTASNVAGIEGTQTIYLNDNGTLTQFSGDPATIELRPNRQIVVMQGTPITQIPNYSWEALPPLSSTPWVLEGGEIGTLGTITWADGSTGAAATGAAVGNLQCLSGLTANFDTSAHLAIYRNGEQLAIPQDIGRTATCEYEVHTHNRSGVIHVASTEYKRFTLGDFFSLWGQPLTATNVAGFTGEPIVIYVEDKGDLRRFMGDPANIDLASHRNIVIQIGSQLTQVPTYDWLNFGPF